MKKATLVLILVALSSFVKAQEIDLLTAANWVLTEDVMSGIGTHKSLTKNTELKFEDNGTWKSSQPILGVTEGTWKKDKKGETIMTFSNRQRAVVKNVTRQKLEIEYKAKGKKVFWKWKGLEE